LEFQHDWAVLRNRSLASYYQRQHYRPNRPYDEKIWAAPHTINPDRLGKSLKPSHFEGFTGKHVFSDGKRAIELHAIVGNSHNDAFLLVYLPKEKILVEADRS